MTEKDIQFLLSGGMKNFDPSLSLGGDVSNFSIDNKLNNLFNDVTGSQISSGSIDYRCIYVKLTSSTEKLKNASVFLQKETGIGAEVSVGLSIASDVQILTIPGAPVGGSFQLSFIEKSSKGTKITTTRDVLWVPDVSFMEQRISALVNSLGNLKNVTCVGQQTSSSYDFVLTFESGRAQELLNVQNDRGLNVVVSRGNIGGPIGRIAPEIGMSNNSPNGVTFISSARREPIKIGTMLPGDFLAIWLKREVTVGLSPIHPDKFGVRIIGEPLPLTSNAVQHFND